MSPVVNGGGGIPAVYAVGDIESHMSLVAHWGGEEDLCHICSGGGSVRHVPSGRWGRRGDLCHVRSGGYSDMYLVGDGGGEANLSNVHNGILIHVLSGRWGGGESQPCTQWGTLSDTCPQRGRISVGDV